MEIEVEVLHNNYLSVAFDGHCGSQRDTGTGLLVLPRHSEEGEQLAKWLRAYEDCKGITNPDAIPKLIAAVKKKCEFHECDCKCGLSGEWECDCGVNEFNKILKEAGVKL